jgi:hypothetical protein
MLSNLRLAASGSAVLLILCCLLCSPALAHHSDVAYDMTKPVVMKGTVTDFYWANPHCLIKYDVDEAGSITHWAGELGSPSALIRGGWVKNSLHAGDQITIYIFKAKVGTPVGRIGRVVLADGTVLSDSQTGNRVKE